MSKKQKGYFEASTVGLFWNGKEYRVAPDVADAIKKRKDYSAEAKKPAKAKKGTVGKK